MKKTLMLCVALVALCAWVGLAKAEDAKTYKGTLACGKCVLKDKDCKECVSVLQVKDGDKTLTYYLVDNDISKAAHPKVCTKAVENVTVTGTVADKDGKMWLTATKIDFPEMKNE